MADKIVSLGDVRKKLYYIFRSYDIPKCVRNDVFGALKKIPEVKAVRHGQWIRTGGYACGDHEFKCSVCDETYWEGTGFADRAHYCSNCGAEMRGGDNNDG